VVDHTLEHSGLEHAHDAGVGHDVPNDDGAVVGAGNGLSVVSVNVDLVNTATVLFERTFHDLGLTRDAPDTHLTFLTTRNDSLTIVSGLDSSYTVVVCVVNSVQKFTGLGQESADLTIGPAGQDRFTIRHEGHTVTLETGHLDSKQLLTS